MSPEERHRQSHRVPHVARRAEASALAQRWFRLDAPSSRDRLSTTAVKSSLGRGARLVDIPIGTLSQSGGAGRDDRDTERRCWRSGQVRGEERSEMVRQDFRLIDRD